MLRPSLELTTEMPMMSQLLQTLLHAMLLMPLYMMVISATWTLGPFYLMVVWCTPMVDTFWSRPVGQPSQVQISLPLQSWLLIVAHRRMPGNMGEGSVTTSFYGTTGLWLLRRYGSPNEHQGLWSSASSASSCRMKKFGSLSFTTVFLEPHTTLSQECHPQPLSSSVISMACTNIPHIWGVRHDQKWASCICVDWLHKCKSSL